MQKVKTIKINDREIDAKELSVAQVKQFMDGLEGGKEEMSMLDLLFPDRIPAAAVSLSTGIPVEELEGDLMPSEYETINQGVEKVNPSFAGMIQRLAAMGKEVLSRGLSTGSSAG